MQPEFSNHLIHESSPYLLQHAHNPVDWYPWGKEAFDKAKREDKPILLSIGYSTCHWCHVMEEESFSDPEVGKVLNRDFVAIKVDREERPDIDHIYMRAAQLMTGSGGWPLTILMTPDRHPFFAATYMPKRPRFGRAGLIDVANRVHELWQTDRDQLLQSATKLTTMLERLNAAGQGGAALQPEVIRHAYESLAKSFDAVHGGFGDRPKFPSPHNLMFLLRYWQQHHDPHALAMVEKTLDGMHAGGIFDQLGGGFHRYSTDNHWLLPHFEKMLYDQAMLLMVYSEAYQATGKQRYAETARRIVDYVKRDLTAPNGAFYSAEDADSEGEEGKFYVWTKAEIESALDKSDAEFAERVFHIKAEGNVHDEATGMLTGANVLYVDEDKAETAKAMGLSESEFDRRLASVRETLLAVRGKRIRPFLDDKVLTDWNGLMIAALATAARALHEPEYAREARRAADFILHNMRTKNGGLLHRFRDDHAGIEGQLDDYAFLTWGLIELYETDFNVRDLQAALDLNGYMLKHFIAESGGLYSTADDAEQLLLRPIDPSDGALPSGNAIAMMNMVRLARLTGDAGLEARAARIANAFAGEINGMPSAFCAMLSALNFAEGTSYEVVLAGDRSSADGQAMLKAIRNRFLPNKVVLWRPEDGKAAEAVVRLAPFTAEQKSIDGKATAYVCRNFQCNLPTTDPEKALALLEADGK